MLGVLNIGTSGRHHSAAGRSIARRSECVAVGVLLLIDRAAFLLLIHVPDHFLPCLWACPYPCPSSFSSPTSPSLRERLGRTPRLSSRPERPVLPTYASIHLELRRSHDPARSGHGMVSERAMSCQFWPFT